MFLTADSGTAVPLKLKRGTGFISQQTPGVYTEHSPLCKMDARWVSSGHGESLTNNIKSGYGTENPGPTAATGFAGTSAVFETLGSAADESNTAQYTPITHPIKVNLKMQSNKDRLDQKTLLPEGTLVMIKPSDRNHDDGYELLVKGSEDDNNPEIGAPRHGYIGQGVIRPLAADLFYGDVVKKRGCYATMAWANVCTIHIPDNNPPLGEAPPCQNVFARMTMDGIQIRWVRARDGDQLIGRLVLAKHSGDSQLSVCLDT